MNPQRSRNQRVPAGRFVIPMFCIKDGRKYFDKGFKTLFRNNKPNDILTLLKTEGSNCSADELAESSGETVLHLAAKYGVIEVVEYLVTTLGCDVNARSADCGWTPLMMAACYGYTDVCKLLLNADADVFATDYLGESALYTATTWVADPLDFAHVDVFSDKLKSLEMDNEQLASALIKATCPLYYIVQLDNEELTKTLRERGYTAPKSPSKDDVLLHDAVALMNLENVKLVCELMNVDVNYLDYYERTALHYAAENGDRNGNVSIIKYLLDKGADINAQGFQGMTPLFAVFNGFMTVEQKKLCIYFLLQHGADPQMLDDNGDTVIDYGMDMAIEDYDETLLDPVMSHLALQEALGVPLVEKLRQQIDEEESLRYYYNSCKRSLDDMKRVTISGSVTLYKLLSESEDQVVEYMRDTQVARSYVHTVFDSNFYYRYVIKKRFIRAMDIIKRERMNVT